MNQNNSNNNQNNAYGINNHNVPQNTPYGYNQGINQQPVYTNQHRPVVAPGSPGGQCHAVNPQGSPGFQCKPITPQGSPGFQVPNGGTGNNSTKPPKQKKVKKKKKHGFLKFLLVVILLVLAYNGIKWGSNKYAQASFDNFMIDYPFASFENETDNPQYITGNFNLYDYGKELGKNVEWKSSNTSVLKIADDSAVTVTRPADKSKNVTITGVYKKFLGKGYQTYNVTVISNNAQAPEDFMVITKEDLQNDVYNRNMEATLDESGNITSMYGDFKNTYIYTAEDGLSWIEAYRSTLNISDQFEFAYASSNDSDTIRTFVYQAYYNGIKCTEQSVILAVDKNTFELLNVNCEFDRAIFNQNIGDIRDDWDYTSIVKTYLQSNGYVFEDVIVLTDTKLAYTYSERAYVAMKVVAVTDKDEVFAAYIDMASGSLLNIKEENHTATGSGKNELNKKKTFPVDGNKLTGYFMVDNKRDIRVYNQLGFYNWVKIFQEKEGFFSGINALLQLYGNELLEFGVHSFDTEFSDKVAVGGYTSIIKVYDWYKDELDYVSYDDNGSPVIINVHSSAMTDNASWSSAFKEITLYNTGDLKYTFGSNVEVLGHEYTHAVFGDLTSNIEDDGSNPSIGAMNEGYADIFGCLISGTDTWLVGENKLKDGTTVYVRDIANYNNKNLINTVADGTLFPTKWHGENWDNEEHIGSVLISHIAWEMYNDPSFTNDDIKNIWYDSLVMGYTSKSDFVSVRRNVIRAMDNRGFSKELQDKVAIWFDEEEIFDDEYVLTTTDNSVEGDIMLDNTTPRRYVVVASILGSAFGDTPIYLYEEVDKPNTEEEKKINSILQGAIDSEIGEITNIKGEKIVLEYKQLPKWKIDILERFVSNSRAQISDIMTGATGDDLDEESQGILDTILNLCIICVVQETTPYEFYEGIGVDIESLIPESSK